LEEILHRRARSQWLLCKAGERKGEGVVRCVSFSLIYTKTKKLIVMMEGNCCFGGPSCSQSYRLKGSRPLGLWLSWARLKRGI